MTKQMKCATEVAKWLGKNGITDGVSIYVDHKRYHVSEAGELVYNIDAEPKEYFKWAGDFMSMSFEGTLYDVINYSFESKWYEKLEQQLQAIFAKYNVYYEQGNAWNLSCYPL